MAIAKETKDAVRELLEAKFAKHPGNHVALCMGAASAIFEEVLAAFAVDRGKSERERGEFNCNYYKVQDDNIAAAQMFWQALPAEFIGAYLQWPERK